MYRKIIVSTVMLLGACAAANAGQIWYNDTTLNTGWVPMAAAGTFNTGGNTNCGVGGACAEISAFNAAVGGVTINGLMSFTTTELFGAGTTTSALENRSQS